MKAKKLKYGTCDAYPAQHIHHATHSSHSFYFPFVKSDEMGNLFACCEVEVDVDEGVRNSVGIFEDKATNQIRYYHPKSSNFDPVSAPGEFHIDQIPKIATGEMVKGGKYTKNANRRYIILIDGHLNYYKGETASNSMDGKTLAGTINLKSYGLKNQSPKTPLHMIFVPISADAEDRTYEFEAIDAESRKAWEKIIDAHAEYYRHASSQ